MGEAYFGTRAHASVRRLAATSARSIEKFRRLASHRNLVDIVNHFGRALEVFYFKRGAVIKYDRAAKQAEHLVLIGSNQRKVHVVNPVKLRRKHKLKTAFVVGHVPRCNKIKAIL